MFLTILSALVGGVIGFAAAGFGAAMLLVSIYGHRDGGVDMGGFFGFGPIGCLAGILLGAGLALRFGRKSLRWGKGLMIGAAVVTVAGSILLAFVSSPDSGPSYAHVIEFQLEYPATSLAGVDIPSKDAMWSGAGGSAEDRPISQFFDKACTGDICILNGSIAALGDLNDFRITTAIGQKKGRYPLNLPVVVNKPVEWTEWSQGDGARVRWRIVNH